MIQWFSKKLKNRKGFTLIELIVVIAILGILAVIAIPRLAGFTDSAEERAAFAEHRIVISAVQMWQSSQSNPATAWPSGIADLDDYIDGGADAGTEFTHTFGDNSFTTTNPHGDDWTYPETP